MSNEVYASALKSTLQEIQNACPDVTSNFIFKDGKLLAKDNNTEEETTTQTIEAFNDITERADILGGLEAVTIQSAEGKVNIATMNDFYLTTVSSNEADEKYVNTLTRVLIPLVIRIVEQIPSASTDKETGTTDQPDFKPEEVETYDANYATEEAVEEKVEETIDEAEYTEKNQSYELEEETAMTEPEVADEPLLADAPVTQLIVESLGGLLVPSDTVRVDEQILEQWNDLYGNNKIKEVEIETLNGKTTRCKFKKIKKSKDLGKGVIKMPEKIQLTLETQEGELVTVKPVVE